MPKTTKQHTWSTPEIATINAGRVSRIIYDPQREVIEISFSLGYESGGTYTESPTRRITKRILWSDLPEGIRLDLIGIEEKALMWAEANIGEFMPGTLETDPST